MKNNNQENDSAMQYFLLTCLLMLISMQIHARTKKNELLLCLAQEEEIIHQGKSTGPIYKLNQVLINKLVVANELHVKDLFLGQICESSTHSPSLKFLHFLLIKGESLFKKGKGKDPKDPFVFQLQIGAELVREAPDIFFSFLSNLQAATPTAKCLETEIPELQEFYERTKHLRGEVSEKNVFHEGNLANRLFSKLGNFNKYFAKCEKRKNQKDKKKSR